MKPILIYTAPRPQGTSAAIAEILHKELSVEIKSLNVGNGETKENIKDFNTLIFMAATYGDQELNDSLEDFIVNLEGDFSDYKYAVCEIGNYYGYDDFELGAGPVIESHMKSIGATQLIPMHSVDSLPVLDKTKLNKWVAKLNSVLVK